MLHAEPCCWSLLREGAGGTQGRNYIKHMDLKVSSSSLGNHNNKRDRVWSGMRRWVLLLRPPFLTSLIGSTHGTICKRQSLRVYISTIYWKVFINELWFDCWHGRNANIHFASCRCYPKTALVSLESINQILNLNYLSWEIPDFKNFCKAGRYFSIPQAFIPNESLEEDRKTACHVSSALLLWL